MTRKQSLEEQVIFLQKTMGGIVKLVKCLKTNVEELQKKDIPKEKEVEKDEVKETLEAQRVIDEVLVANCDAIKRIDMDIQRMTKSKNVKHVKKKTLEKVTLF